ncbi:MAG: heat-inducible transcription repressor HrcA [Acidimicrobiia bacterium]|nr:heat-inducible transcription repressor HrcA [Acidimicrobiia bacterium]
MGEAHLSDRAERLLAALVQAYVERGEAVSSSTLAAESRLGVSSATVRNMLARLEEEGYVHQPHTSAGRVPTDRAYRVFVNRLLGGRRSRAAAAAVEQELRQQAGPSPLPDELLAVVTHLVSRASRHVAFALATSHERVLHRIEFVPLGGSRVLVVVVSRGDQVTQKVIDAGEEVSHAELVQAANYLNTEFEGLALPDVRQAVLARLRQEQTLYDRLVARALRLASSTLEQFEPQQSFHVEGASSLLEAAAAEAVVTLPTLRALLEMIEEKTRLIHLLNQCIDGPGITVVIGAEHTSPHLRPFSLVAATSMDGTTARTVGIIGPTRMRYSRAIGVVDTTALAVSRVLGDVH